MWLGEGDFQPPGAEGPLVRQSTFWGLANHRLSNTQAGAYAQDTWAISKRFVFQGGLRTDWDRLTQSATAGPRASATFMPFPVDPHKLSPHWGISTEPPTIPIRGTLSD